MGKDDARSQDGVAEQRFSKAVTDVVDLVSGAGAGGRRPRKSADPEVPRGRDVRVEPETSRKKLSL